MGQSLEKLIETLDIITIKGDCPVEVNAIRFDSRQVKRGDLFVAQRGTHVDGHDYISKAIALGACVVVCEQLPMEMPGEVCFILVENASVALAHLAASYYCNPSNDLQLVGVTGTNGKTTIATLLFRTFKDLGYKVGLLSTVTNQINDKVIKSTHTTPDAVQINLLLKQMVDEGCEYCFMEVSSHAVDQYRTSALNFKGGIFTNITHDHLDYHKTFSAYIKAKKRFFDNLGKHSFALTNADDRNGKLMLQNCQGHKFSYSTRSLADFRSKVLERHFDGMLLEIDDLEVWTQFIGDFNAHNLLAVYGAACLLDQPREEILKVMSQLQAVPGRFESIISPNGVMAIVDYAHTPDALKNVLETIEQLRTHNEQVITVVGCGGDRDKTKRPEMGDVAAQYSNRVILTSDNPRSEDPDQIIQEMRAGVAADKCKNVLAISSRSEAIRTACMMSQKGDIILVAGKGHEDYQEINGVKHHFDDKEVIKEIFNL